MSRSADTSFPSAVAAVTAVLQIQRDMAGGEVRLRVELNAERGDSPWTTDPAPSYR